MGKGLQDAMGGRLYQGKSNVVKNRRIRDEDQSRPWIRAMLSPFF